MSKGSRAFGPVVECDFAVMLGFSEIEVARGRRTFLGFEGFRGQASCHVPAM